MSNVGERGVMMLNRGNPLLVFGVLGIGACFVCKYRTTPLRRCIVKWSWIPQYHTYYEG